MSSMQASDEKKESRPTGMTVGGFVARFGAVFGLAILVIILAILSPVFLKPDNLWNISRQATVNAMLAVGMLLAIITAGIDLSVGSVLALSMSVLATLAIKMHVNPFVAMAAALAVGLGMGMINGLLLTRLHLPHPFIATLGTMNIARGLALIITGASPISGFDRAGARVVLILGAGSLYTIPVAFLVVLIIYAIYHVLLSNTALGRHIYAVGGNTPAARLSGINVDKTLLIVYSLCGFMAGMGAWNAGRAHQLRLSHRGDGRGTGCHCRGHHRRRQFRRRDRHSLGNAHRRGVDRGLAQRSGAAQGADRVADRRDRPGHHRRGRMSMCSASEHGVRAGWALCEDLSGFRM